MEYVEVARAESERGEVVLRSRRPEHGSTAPAVLELRVNGVFVMDTLETSSERALATAALAELEGVRAVLLGGLGLGFTLHEVLGDSRVESVTVVEVEEALVRWMRDGTVPHGPSYLADERVTVVVADLREALAETAPDSFDLILLDVDNGPDFLVFEANAALYTPEFLVLARDRLRERGRVAIWSSTRSERLEQVLSTLFDDVRASPSTVTLQGRAVEYWLYSAGRGAPDAGR